jgi:clan AA aspartic protease (TIGR02281 family)
MRKLVFGLLILLAGWGLGWLTSHYWRLDPQYSTRSPATVTPTPGYPEKEAGRVATTGPANAVDTALLLQRNEFAAVLERYESLQVVGDEAALAHARAQILAHARQLIVEHRFSQAEQLLQRFLVAAYRDVEARILLAEVYAGQDDLRAAIDQLYEARGYAWRQATLQNITVRIRAVVAELKKTLQRNADSNAMLALYQHLVELEPDHAAWFLELAAAQLALDDKAAARSTLLLIAQDPDVGARAQAMLSELSVAFVETRGTGALDSASQVAGIPLTRSGNHFIVDARATGGRSMQLLIDTGASLTIFTPEVLAQGGIRYRDTGRTAVFNTANGQVRAPVYTLDSLAVGDWQVSQIEIGVLDLGDRSGVDGLLGMNFLSHFRFFIDQNQAELRLSGD